MTADMSFMHLRSAASGAIAAVGLQPRADRSSAERLVFISPLSEDWLRILPRKRTIVAANFRDLSIINIEAVAASGSSGAMTPSPAPGAIRRGTPRPVLTPSLAELLALSGTLFALGLALVWRRGVE